MALLDVTIDRDFQRILDLPRRLWTSDDLARLQDVMTRTYRTPNGAMRANPTQAQAWLEARKMGGAYISAPVGAGKTLLGAVMPTVLEAKNPALFVPASLKAKTYADLAELREHWQIPKHLFVLTYELLQHKKQRELLRQRRFDLIIFDEVDGLKMPDALVGPRMARVLEYLKEAPDTKIVAMTGTPISKSLMDFWHHVLMCLKTQSPLPLNRDSAKEWAEALDVEPPMGPFGLGRLVVRSPCNLLRFGDGTEQGDEHDRALESVQKRLNASWGFVNIPGMSSDQPINIQPIDGLTIPSDVASALNLIEATGETLNGDILETALERAEYRRQVGCGFFYLWDPKPPDEWLAARKAWKRFVRDRLIEGGYADSPSLVEDEYRDHPYRLEWRRVEKLFDPSANLKVAWLSHYLLDDLISRVESASIVRVSYQELGKELANVSGWPYFGGGKQASDQIRSETGTRTIIASIDAHSIGKNLQKFNRSYVVNPPSDASRFEQLIGRTHRQGQTREVWIHPYVHTTDQAIDFARAQKRARLQQQLLGQPQKLLVANYL